jgi:2-polyprenyl-3-methyl-5-hydroxy-6-metoxy-1,4-benzoquinol methylase
MLFHYSSFFNRLGYKNYAYSLYKCSECFLVTIYPPACNESYPSFLNVEIKNSPTNDFPRNDLFLQTIKKFKSSGEFIDIGCNTGFFVKAAKENGFNSIGVEIDEIASNQAILLGHNVLKGDFLNMSFSTKFDVIVLNHVMEHIPDFSKLSAKLDDMLADDGVIFINIPHYHGLISRIMKNKWAALAPFTHVWLHSTTSMRRLFKNHFKSIIISTNSASEPHGYDLDFKTNVKTAIIQIANILSMGDEMKVILRKNK